MDLQAACTTESTALRIQTTDAIAAAVGMINALYPEVPEMPVPAACAWYNSRRVNFYATPERTPDQHAAACRCREAAASVATAMIEAGQYEDAARFALRARDWEWTATAAASSN